MANRGGCRLRRIVAGDVCPVNLELPAASHTAWIAPAAPAAPAHSSRDAPATVSATATHPRALAAAALGGPIAAAGDQPTKMQNMGNPWVTSTGDARCIRRKSPEVVIAKGLQDLAEARGGHLGGAGCAPPEATCTRVRLAPALHCTRPDTQLAGAMPRRPTACAAQAVC